MDPLSGQQRGLAQAFELARNQPVRSKGKDSPGRDAGSGEGLPGCRSAGQDHWRTVANGGGDVREFGTALRQGGQAFEPLHPAAAERQPRPCVALRIAERKQVRRQLAYCCSAAARGAGEAGYRHAVREVTGFRGVRHQYGKGQGSQGAMCADHQVLRAAE